MIQPVCVLNAYGDTLSLKVNGFKEDYTELHWFESSTGEELYSELKSPFVKVSNLTEQNYTFMTYNPVQKVFSEPMEIFIQNRNPQARVDLLWKFAEVEKSTYNDELKESLVKRLTSNPAASLLYVLYSTYVNIKSPQEFETELFYHLILVQEKYENLQLGNLNRDGAGFAKIRIAAQPTIEFSDNVNTIKIYRIEQKKELLQVYRVFDTEKTLSLPDYGYYEIQLLQGTELFTVLRHCQLSTDYVAAVWENSQSLLESYLNNVEDDFSISTSAADFSQSEKVKYLEEQKFTPKNTLFPRIEIEESNVNRCVDLFVSGVRFAMASKHKFFVSGCDADYLQDTVENQFFRIYGSTNSFSTKFEPVSNMIDREALLYIVDEDNRIVSRVTRCLFDEDWTTTLVDYHEKIREMEVKDYTKRLCSHVLETYPAAWEYTQEMSYRCIEDTGINVDNILEELLNQVDSAPSEIFRDKLSFEILKDWFSVTNYNSEFFTQGGFTWAPYTHTLTAEESEDGYVLCVIAKETGDETFSRNYVHSLDNQAIQFLLNRYGKYVVYAISEKDYRYSGFLYVNTVTGYMKSYLVNLGVR